MLNQHNTLRGVCIDTHRPLVLLQADDRRARQSAKPAHADGLSDADREALANMFGPPLQPRAAEACSELLEDESGPLEPWDRRDKRAVLLILSILAAIAGTLATLVTR